VPAAGAKIVAVTDEPNNEESKTTPTGSGTRTRRMRTIDPRYSQPNFASRLFPGPSEQMSRQFRQHIEGLLKPPDSDAAPTDRGSRPGRTPTTDDDQRRTRGPLEGRSSAAEPGVVATPEDVAQVRDKLEEQNELLRAILASSVDTQEDARATAQNSRTFAWAGTAIALLTLIATVIAIVAAIRA
jgi:hypothetical protein